MFLFQMKWFVFVSAVLCAVASCESNESPDNGVLIGADPPSMYKGENLNVRLTADREFFVGELDAPLVSAGGLVLRELVRKDDTQAVVAFETDDETTVGIHEFKLNIGGVTGVLQVSVLAPDQGPGEVTVQDNTGSSGVELGRFTILGKGTRFDEQCAVEIEGADGVSVQFIEAESSTTIYVYYSIDINQEPTEATVILMDGDYRYEAPFSIVDHLVLDNEIEDQVLTKGRVGDVVLYHKDASLLSTTIFENTDNAVETGEATVGRDMAAVIPVRVPIDYEEDVLHLTGKTFTNNGSMLELINVDIHLVEPAYIAVQDAKLDLVQGEKEKAFVVYGMDAWDIDNIVVEDNTGLLSIVDWRAEDTKLGSISFLIRDGLEEGAFDLSVETATGQAPAGVLAVSDWESRRAHVPSQSIPKGDRRFVPVVVQGGDLDKSSLAAQADKEIKIHDVIYIDAFSAVLDLEIAADASIGAKTVSLHGEEYDYDISLDVIASGV